MVSRIAVLANLSNPNAETNLKDVQSASHAVSQQSKFLMPTALGKRSSLDPLDDKGTQTEA